MRKLILTLAAAVALAASPAMAQDAAYPDTSQTIHLIIPNSAGGGTDIAGRLLAEGLEQKLGTTVIVENLSGAGGIEGATKLGAELHTRIYDEPGREFNSGDAKTKQLRGCTAPSAMVSGSRPSSATCTICLFRTIISTW